MARRAAPKGTKATFEKVVKLAEKFGVEKAAQAFGVSERRVKSISRAIEKGKPLGSIIHSKRGLDKWTGRTETAKESLPAQRRAQELLGQNSRTEIIISIPGKENEISEALKRAENLEATHEDKLLLNKIKKTPTIISGPDNSDAARALDAGWEYFSNDKLCKEQHPDAIIASRAFANMDDALNKLKDISREYFAIVRTPRGNRFDLYLYDIRTAKEREAHYAGKRSGKHAPSDD